MNPLNIRKHSHGLTTGQVWNNATKLHIFETDQVKSPPLPSPQNSTFVMVPSQQPLDPKKLNIISWNLTENNN